jgi:hypothetical protein
MVGIYHKSKQILYSKDKKDREINMEKMGKNTNLAKLGVQNKNIQI